MLDFGDGSWALWLLTGTASLIGGLLVAFWAWLGRPINDHPVCQTCQFDLVGNIISSKCPECGAPLTTRHAIQPGARQRRKKMIATGLLISAVGLASFAMLGWQQANQIDWQKAKPFTFLLWEANRSGQTADAAIGELERRISDDELTGPQVATLVESALRIQRDHARPWDARWGNIVGQAALDGQITEAQWTQYAQHGLHNAFNLRVRQRVALAHPIVPFVIEGGPGRVGDDYRVLPSFVLEIDTLKAQVGDVTVDLRPKTATIGDEDDDQQVIVLSPDKWPDLEPGRYELHITGKGRLSDWAGGSDSFGGLEPVAEIDFHLTDDFELSREPVLKPVRSPDLASAVRQAININGIKLEQNDDAGHTTLWHSFGFLPSPVNLAFEAVAVADDGREWPLATICEQADGKSHGWQLWSGLPLNPGETVPERITVECRPAPSVAAGTIDLYEYWAEPVIFENVPVVRGPIGP